MNSLLIVNSSSNAQPPIICSQWISDETPENMMLKLINDTRKGSDNTDPSPQVILSKELSVVAKEHADNMVNTQKFSHKIDGKNSLDRVRAAGLCESDTLVSENIAMIGGTILVTKHVTNVLEAFKGSPSHYKNIVDPRWEWIGIAYSIDLNNKRIVWVIMFANKLANPYQVIPFYLRRS